MAYSLPWSHPAWVCGLKLFCLVKREYQTMSHPAWVCGLKLFLIVNTVHFFWSHPAWVCGLKHDCTYSLLQISSSHPAWVCGLKLPPFSHLALRLCHTLRGCVDWNFIRMIHNNQQEGHTLRGCVDWNSDSNIDSLAVDMSHPAWVCGLKPEGTPYIDAYPESHPAWVCGLKLRLLARLPPWRKSHPAWVCGLKPEEYRISWQSWSHTLRGCVDWNTFDYLEEIPAHGHTLRGCIWIEALFTRWSSLWKNCKHSASCVFLFKLL